MRRRGLTVYTFVVLAWMVTSTGCDPLDTGFPILPTISDDSTATESDEQVLASHPSTPPGSTSDSTSGSSPDPAPDPAPEPTPEPTAKMSATLAVAMVPPHYPNFSSDDVSTMLAETTQVGAASVILSWDDPELLQSATSLTEWAKQSGMPILLAISPTSVLHRDQLVLPARLQGVTPSFKDASVKQAFIDDALAVARLQPDYLCLGTEVNLLNNGSPEEFTAFAAVYAQAYDAIRAEGLSAVVFPSFYWDEMYVQSGGVHDTSIDALLNAFRPRLDAMGITTYPMNFWPSPLDMPGNLYQALSEYVQPDERLVVVEVGWPSQGGGSAAQQVTYLQTLPGMWQNLNLDWLGWSLLHDVPSSVMPASLGTTGLYQTNGQSKLAWSAFLALKP